jgi:hypothetical protein
LGEKLTEADAWVYKLAGDRRETSLKFARLHRKLNDLNKKNLSLLARLEAPRVDLSLVARMEAAEREVSEQRRLAAGELEQLFSINAALTEDNSNLNERLVALSSARMDVDRKLNERQTEIAQMALMLASSEASGSASAENFSWLRAVHAVLLRGPRFRWLRSRHFIKKWHYNELRRQGLFDHEAYSKAYPDVGEEGMDPLDHYIRHGRLEGRGNGI